MADYNDALNRNNPSVQERTKAQNRANVLQLKLIGQSHPTGLTANLLKLFEPRPPLEFKPPPEKRICPPYTGMAQFVSRFAEPTDPEYAPPVAEGETLMIHLKIQLVIHTRHFLLLGLIMKPPNTRSNKSLKLMEQSRGCAWLLIRKQIKPRGYAFIEYVHTHDMKTAYKQADGRKLDNRRVLVDVELGRTVPNWQPRRLGGGLGTTS